MKRLSIVAAALMGAASPLAAQTVAITGGTVALGDGSDPIPNGMVVIRDGRVIAAGDVRMKLPADTQVIDATGKWVTPGIVAGFSRLGYRVSRLRSYWLPAHPLLLVPRTIRPPW